MAPNDNNNNSKKSLADSAKDTIKDNPSALGDPVSLKAEKSSSSPTPDDKGAAASKGKETLSDKAKKNATMLGDPVSLKAEASERPASEENSAGAAKGRENKSKL